MPIDTPSVNVPGTAPASSEVEPDRRTRKRDQKRRALLAIAGELFDEGGTDSVTLGAIAERADLTTPSLYTYFDSKSALLAALQRDALAVLAVELAAHTTRWNVAAPGAEEGSGLEPVRDASVILARLVAFSDLFLDAPKLFRREFRLQQQLLNSAGAETVEDAATVLPAALEILAVPQALIEEATQRGVLGDEPHGADPLTTSSMGRTVMWMSALNGILLADSLTVGLPATGKALGDSLTRDLLVGWGAPLDLFVEARSLANRWIQER